MCIEDWRQYELEKHRVEAIIRVELQVSGGERPHPAGGQEKLAIHGVSKRFRVRGGFVDALTDVTLSVRDGEFVCLVGPSGCGKSTLLNIVAGLDRPSKGEVMARGRPVEGSGPDRILLFQEPALFPWLTVQQNVEFGLKIRGMTKEERTARAMDGLCQVGLAEFAGSYIHQLSGGMKQRAALARALVLDPELLLLDEPFAALDSQSRDLLHQKLLEVWARTGKTILFVTHHVPEALRLADRIVVFSARPGRVIREFPVSAARPRPVEQGALCEISDAIHQELRAALTSQREGGERRDRPSAQGGLLPDVDCPLGADR